MPTSPVKANLSIPLHVQLRDQLKMLILGGVLAPGRKLPGVRELAGYLGVNRHTVSRALHQLAALGFVVIVHGRGTFIADQVPAIEKRDSQRFAEIADRAIRESIQLGFSYHDLASLVLARGASAPGDEAIDLRIAFIECNDFSLQRYAADLREQLDVRVDAMLISDLRRKTLSGWEQASNCDLVVTTVGHTPEVRRILGDEVEIFSITLGPYLRALLDVLALPAEQRVGIITASEAGSLGMKQAMIHAGLVPERLCLASAEQPELIAQTVCRVDALVVSSSVMEAVKRLLPEPPPRIVEYHNVLDQTGIEALKERLRDMRAKRATRAAGGVRSVDLLELKRVLQQGQYLTDDV